jgi:hypothetical protein
LECTCRTRRPWLARASSPSPGRRLATDADPLGPGETGTGCLSKHVVPWYRSHALRRDQPALGQRIASGMFEPVALGTVAQQATQPRSGPGQPDNVGSYAHDVISFPVECVQAPTCWPLASRTGLPRLIQPPQYRELSRKRDSTSIDVDQVDRQRGLMSLRCTPVPLVCMGLECSGPTRSPFGAANWAHGGWSSPSRECRLARDTHERGSG